MLDMGFMSEPSVLAIRNAKYLVQITTTVPFIQWERAKGRAMKCRLV